jgi:hypothetical protein
MRHVPAPIVAVEKQWVLHNLSVSEVSDIQHAMRMRHIVICGLPCSTIFSTLSHKPHDFRKKSYWTQNVCFIFPLQILSATFLILRRTEWYLIKMCGGHHVKYQLFLSYCNKNWRIVTEFWKNTQILNFTIIRPVGAELLHAHRRTDVQTWRNW